MKLLVAITGKEVAPRFDLVTEVCIVESGSEPRIILLPTSSGEELCALIIRENAKVVVCGGIEESYHQYLSWKKIRVIDSVIGPSRRAIELAVADKLVGGTILPGARRREGEP